MIPAVRKALGICVILSKRSEGGMSHDVPFYLSVIIYFLKTLSILSTSGLYLVSFLWTFMMPM